MLVKDTWRMENNKTSTKMKLLLDSSGDKYREFDRELKMKLIEGVGNTYVNYKAYGTDDPFNNTYSNGLMADVEDIHSFANLLRDIADYLDGTDEYMDRITITYKED